MGIEIVAAATIAVAYCTPSHLGDRQGLMLRKQRYFTQFSLTSLKTFCILAKYKKFIYSSSTMHQTKCRSCVSLATITKYHSLGVLNKRHLFQMLGSLRSTCWLILFLIRACFLADRCPYFGLILHDRERKLLDLFAVLKCYSNDDGLTLKT